MTIKSIGFVLIFFFAAEFLSTDGSTLLYQPYILSPAFPLIDIANLKSIFDTDKPDAELGNDILEIAKDVKTIIPWSRSLVAKMSAAADRVEQFYPRLIDAGLRLKDGRSNPTYRTLISEEIRSIAEVTSVIADELKKLVEEGENAIEKSRKISDNLKEKKDDEP